MPGHIAQSLSWYGTQAEAFPQQIKEGKRVLTPTSFRDPRGLNPLSMPRL